MKVYIDIFLLENIIINLFLLLLTFKLLRFEYKTSLIYLASVLGGLYGLVIFSNVKILTSPLLKVMIPLCMITIAIKNRKIINILKSTGVFFLVAFMLSGICFQTLQLQNTYLLGKDFIIKNNSIKFITIGGLILAILIIRIVDILKDRAMIKNFLYDIYITEGSKAIFVKGFLDTGNELREPVTNLPCIILESSYFNEFKVSDEKTYVIKYDTINEVGEIKGFKGNNILIKNDQDNNWSKIEAIVCGCERKLSKIDEFQALLSRGIV